MTTEEQKLYVAFRKQRSNAEGNGIGFLLTFEEWTTVWEESGHLHERGRGKNKYVMARYGDRGPYAIDNIKIISNIDNVREAYNNKTPEELENWKESMRRNGQKSAGREQTIETRTKRSISVKAARAKKYWSGKKRSSS